MSLTLLKKLNLYPHVLACHPKPNLFFPEEEEVVWCQYITGLFRRAGKVFPLEISTGLDGSKLKTNSKSPFNDFQITLRANSRHFFSRNKEVVVVLVTFKMHVDRTISIR